MLPTELPNENVNEPEPQSPTSPTPELPQPQANYATREEIGAIAESVRALAQAIQAGPTNQRVTPTGPTPMSDEEIMAAINEGKPAAAIARLRDEIEASVRSKYIDPMQQHNLGAVATLVRDAAKADPKMKHFARFEKEIDKLVAGVPLAQRANIDCYRTAYGIVVGANQELLEQEAVERALRAANAGDGGQIPGGTKGSHTQPGVPTVTELLGADAQLALDQRGWTPDIYAQRFLKKKDWATAAADIVKYNQEHPTNA